MTPFEFPMHGIGTFALVGVIVFLGQVVYSSIGFGAALVSISLLSLFFGNLDLIVPFFLLLCLPVEAWVSLRDWKQLNFSSTWKILLAMSPFLVAGSFFLKHVEDGRLLFLMGIVVITTGIYYLKYEKKLHIKRAGPWLTLLTGAGSGLLGSLFGMSGPPLVIYYQSLSLSKSEFRVALISIFFGMGLFRAAVYSWMGFYSVPMIHAVLLFLPFSLCGLWLGNFMHHKINEAHFRKGISILLTLSGLLLVLKHCPI